MLFFAIFIIANISVFFPMKMSMLGGWLHDYLLQRQFFLYFSSLKRFFSVNLHNQLFVYDSFRKELLVFFIWQKKKNELWSQKGIPFLKGCLLPNPRKNLWKKFEEKSKIRYYILINSFSWKLNTIEIFWNFWTLLSW